MPVRELEGGAAASVKADQVPPYIVTFATSGFLPVSVFNAMAMTKGNQPPQIVPLVPAGEPLFGTHLREALRILRPKREP